MLKGVYLYSEGIVIAKMLGVINKINDQINAFNESGLKCTPYKLRTFKNRLLNIYPFDINEYFSISNVDIKDCSYVYIRKPGVIDFYFINILKQIKKYNNNIKIVMEIPTYPYDYEFERNISGFIKKTIDRLYREKLHRYIDFIAIIGDEKKVFKVNTLFIDNGVDFSKYTKRKPKFKNKKAINLCAIANFYGSHGYERLIKGIYNYIRSEHDYEVTLHMVGDGPSLKDYKLLTSDLKLDKNVLFYGYLTKDKLRDVYNKCDASVGSLAAYRKKIYDTHELKSTEALAYGIPFICGCKSSRLTNKKFKYFLELPNDNSDIDVNRIVDFIKSLYINEDINDITNNIRSFGEKYFSISECMKNVINYFKI